MQLFDQTHVAGPTKLINIGRWLAATSLLAPAPSVTTGMKLLIVTLRANGCGAIYSSLGLSLGRIVEKAVAAMTLCAITFFIKDINS